ncbi:T-cell-specific guanine nucleotide triphosphate-binding protein 2-like [Mytilus edulis]|uniref:T-cell-specific guanine nucleotide triphosphate-binding protein 2-like n=1 Tax=Mytilus edulis TaxID=6550 RepID=UPI0039EFF509
MGKAESKELTKDDEYAELRVIAEKQGPSAVSKYLQEHISQCKKEKVAFAITGRTATGKSTFINKMNNVNPGDIGFAKSGSGNTTKKPTAYLNPQNKRIVFYDLPGVGTMEFPKATYAEEMELERYDYFFIFFDKVISEDDYFLVCKLVELKKSFCLMRSKIDEDLRNAEDDGKREEEVIPVIREQITEQISRDKHLMYSDAIFLISSRRKDKGDWSQLLCHVENCLPPTKFESLLKTFFTNTYRICN